MPDFIDLHTHSVFSDGSLTPAELIARAAQVGLQAVALTDHDTVDGIEEAIAAGATHGVEVVAGVELSAAHGGQEVHILGYFIERRYLPLREALQRFREARFSRAEKMVAQLNRAGVPLVIGDVMAQAGNSPLGRPHVAQALVQKGYAQTFDEAFRKYLSRGGVANVPKECWSPRQAMDLIHGAGGLAVVAHPACRIHHSALESLLAQGLDGIEVLHPLHGAEDRKDFSAFALRHRLCRTGGSDYHGAGRSSCALGAMRVPGEWLEQLKARSLTLQNRSDIL
jgi:hypothetical protein